MKKALIFIPGIKGTKIFDANTMNNEILWQDFRYNFEDFGRMQMSMPVAGKYYDQTFDALVSALQLEPLAYSKFWRKLEPDYEWKFLFPYDWRLPNEVNADKLNDFINFIIEKSKALVDVEDIRQVDIVTHSMGNYPARYYVKKYGFDKVNKIIFVAPPFKGAADAFTAFTIGQGLFFNKEETRKLVRTLPALFELLPRYENSNVEKASEQPLDIFDIKNWQTNLVTLDRSTEKNKTIKNFIANIESVSERLDDLDKWLYNVKDEEKNRMLVLVKTDFKTFTNLLIEKKPKDNQKGNYFNIEDSLYVDEGDGVVPNASSCCYYDEIATYAVYNETWRDDKKHAFVMKDSRFQLIINKFLNSSHGADKFVPELIGRSVKKVTGLVDGKKGIFKYKKIVVR